MQATVVTFDADQGNGSVVLDDGTSLPFSASAFEGSGLRFLRPGQRVSVVVAGAGATATVEAFHLGRVGRVADPVEGAQPRS
jgi:2-phospho-L-lactate guanylyltransferase